MLFRVAFVADLVNIIVFPLLAFALYQLLKPVNQQIAATFVIFNAVAAAIMAPTYSTTLRRCSSRPNPSTRRRSEPRRPMRSCCSSPRYTPKGI